MTSELPNVLGIVAAALGGAAVGVEREWSGHAAGPRAHFAGVRTFTLLGGLAGLTGWLWTEHYEVLAAVLLAGAAGLVVAAYVAASQRSIDGTTEVAALVVLAAGVLAGTSRLVLASGVIAITSLLLVEKSRLHAMVARIDDAGMRAGVRFAVMAVVILPLLPVGPYGPLGGVRPRELWLFVLLFSALSFAGYVARRLVGARRGYSVAGLLGGFISSTTVTLTFARASVRQRADAAALACGVTAACTVMFLRMLAATAVLHWPLALALAPYLVAPLLAGTALTIAGMLRLPEESRDIATPGNPLEFWAAIQMAALFQLVLLAVAAARALWGPAGLLASGAVLGLTDVDALVISMARSVAVGSALGVAAQALALGTLANGVLKLALALAVGEARFRRLAGVGLVALAVASGASLVLLW